MALYANPWQQQSDPGVTMADSFFNSNPDLAYRRQLNENLGQGWNQSAFGRYAGSQYSNMYDDYQVETPKRDLNYTFTNYLAEHGGDLQKQFRGISPNQRGERQGAYTGRVRWTGI